MTSTILLLLVTIAVSIMALNNPAMLSRLTMSPFHISRKGEYWRLLTSGFVHASWAHLGFNMFTFFFFGQAAEAIVTDYTGGSTIAFVLFYLAAIVLSDLPTYLRHRHHLHYQSLGASGGVTAVVFCSILFYPLNKICLYGFICLPGFILGAVYIFYSIFQARQMTDNVNHSAHLMGALTGIIFSVAIHPGVLSEFLSKVLSFRIF